MDAQVASKPNGSLIQPPPDGRSLLFRGPPADGASPGSRSSCRAPIALASYTGIDRPTKDVDVFAKAGDALKLLHYFKEHGFDVEIVDERWLYAHHARRAVRRHHHQHADRHHARHRRMVRQRARRASCSARKVRLVPPTQFIWSKIFVQDHHRYDMADVAHMILKMPRPDRLAAAAQPHGALLGSAADGAAQLPLRLSERAPPGPALADGRAARAAARPI